jgi:hypothetical protein
VENEAHRREAERVLEWQEAQAAGRLSVDAEQVRQQLEACAAEGAQQDALAQHEKLLRTIEADGIRAPGRASRPCWTSWRSRSVRQILAKRAGSAAARAASWSTRRGESRPLARTRDRRWDRALDDGRLSDSAKLATGRRANAAAGRRDEDPGACRA